MKKIQTNKAPEAVWPYSQAIISGNMLYVSGQIWLNPETMKLVEWWVIAELKQLCDNMWEILKEAWLSYENIVKTTILLDDMSDFWEVNKVYAEYLSHKPARATFEVSKLPLWAKIEIEAIAEI